MGLGEERKRPAIPSYDSTANNSNNTSLLNGSVIESRGKDERITGSRNSNNLSFDIPNLQKNSFHSQNPNLTMYFPESRAKKTRRPDVGGMNFYGTVFNGFPGKRTVLK